ncbi:cell division protein FtsQ/DivIB [Streptomyces sp. O3]
MAGPTTAERGARKRGTQPARPPSTPRRRRPWPPSPRARLPLLASLVAAALLGGGGGWLLYGSPWLRVEHVGVSGTRVLTPAEVRDAAAVPVGAPLISVDTGAIEDRLRRELPRIDSVDAVRSWPRGISLKVTEREPVLVLRKGGRFVEVDADGVRFATVADAPKGVPALELSAADSPSLNRYGTGRLMRAAVRVAGDLPAAVARDTRTVKVRSYDSISLELTKGRTVAWGSSERGAAKAVSLTALMKAAPKAGHFDVTAPTAPAASRS